jgi:Ca2+-binding EF-hand superfamily protein
MSSTISATSTTTTTDALFAKLDTKKKGYLDATDLKTAAGATEADDAKAAEAFKQIDTDSDGKVTKSELSTAIDKVSDQLNAQLDSSRAASSAAGAKPAGGGGGGAPPVASASSDTETAKYVAAADTDSDGTVTAAEAAAYKKLEAASAEAKALAQVQEYKDNSGTTEAATSGTVDVSV